MLQGLLSWNIQALYSASILGTKSPLLCIFYLARDKPTLSPEFTQAMTARPWVKIPLQDSELKPEYGLTGRKIGLSHPAPS